MIITRRCILTGNTAALDLPVTVEQWDRWLEGMSAQAAFPQLDAGQREFIISGITPEQWDCLYGDEP